MGRILLQPLPGEVKLNLFQPPVPGDNLAQLSHHFVDGYTEILQTTVTAVIPEYAVCGCCFVFSDIDVMLNGVEVAGMRLVRLLRGRATENGAKAVYAPSFPCRCSGFYDFHLMQSDACYILWYDVVQCGISLLTKCLSCFTLAQGTEFCSKQSPAVALDAWKWDWLVKQFFFFGSPLMIHSFCHAKKHLTLRKGGVVVAISNTISQSWLRLQTTEQLSALKYVFRSSCLFGLCDKVPHLEKVTFYFIGAESRDIS